MASTINKVILWTMVVVSLLLLVAKVDGRHRERSFKREYVTKHYSKHSHIGDLWHHLGEPFRTIHSAYALLLGLSTKRRGGGQTIHPEKSSTVLPTIFPYTTIAPKTDSPRSELKSCSVTNPGSDPELEMRNMRQLETEGCGRLETRIFGGENAMPGEFPWNTLIESEQTYFPGKFSYVCVGSLITDRYVLTAAHCVAKYGYIVRSVVLGEYNIETVNDPCLAVEKLFLEIVSGKPCETDPPLKVNVECTIVHPKYSNKTLKHPNDIALIRTEKPVVFTAYIEPICLPVGEFNVRIKEELDYRTKLTVSGWGKTMNESMTSIPMKADIYLMDEETCKSWHNFMDEEKLCAGEKNGKSACRGDSGGPLFTRKMMETNEIGEGEIAHQKRPKAIQVGIISTGSSGCDEPSLFTYIPNYLPWILSNIKP
ncbi:phenoloxidase-activating factor 3-like [Ischnura elegans]|uniref:phenoloxidase-activating factor 3-like n=1 Tax=Ischnura elegans TaxID=197161 RepID=UPI001ED86D1A|nr:phenoloxidase-activating factor 3-like [Ischnura elegans]